MNNTSLQNAIKLILAANPASVAAEIKRSGDGIDTHLSNLSHAASVVHALGNLITSEQRADSDSNLKAMEYGEALHNLMKAKEASVYVDAIAMAHEASNDVAFTEVSEPHDFKSFAKAVKQHVE